MNKSSWTLFSRISEDVCRLVESGVEVDMKAAPLKLAAVAATATTVAIPVSINPIYGDDPNTANVLYGQAVRDKKGLTEVWIYLVM